MIRPFHHCQSTQFFATVNLLQPRKFLWDEQQMNGHHTAEQPQTAQNWEGGWEGTDLWSGALLGKSDCERFQGFPTVAGKLCAYSRRHVLPKHQFAHTSKPGVFHPPLPPQSGPR
eukprot:218652_1